MNKRISNIRFIQIDNLSLTSRNVHRAIKFFWGCFVHCLSSNTLTYEPGAIGWKAFPLCQSLPPSLTPTEASSLIIQQHPNYKKLLIGPELFLSSQIRDIGGGCLPDFGPDFSFILTSLSQDKLKSSLCQTLSHEKLEFLGSKSGLPSQGSCLIKLQFHGEDQQTHDGGGGVALGD